MAFMSCMGPCISCHQIFSFNPDLVPSIRVKGKREPVCRGCMEAANVKRKALGLTLLPILPGAYDDEEVP